MSTRPVPGRTASVGLPENRSPRAGPFPGRVGHQDPRAVISTGDALLHPDSGQAGVSPEMVTVLEGIPVAAPEAGGPADAPSESWPTRPTPRGQPADLSDAAARPPSPSRPTKPPTAPTRTSWRPTPRVRPCHLPRPARRRMAFSELKHHRGFATRHDKLAVRYAATVHVASIDHWLRDLSNRT